MKNGDPHYSLHPALCNQWYSDHGTIAKPHTYIVDMETPLWNKTCSLCKRVVYPGEIMGEYYRYGCGKRIVCESCASNHEKQ